MEHTAYELITEQNTPLTRMIKNQLYKATDAEKNNLHELRDAHLKTALLIQKNNFGVEGRIVSKFYGITRDVDPCIVSDSEVSENCNRKLKCTMATCPSCERHTREIRGRDGGGDMLYTCSRCKYQR